MWCPEQLLQCVLAHIHYMPDHWRGHANKSETRDEVAQLFQYKAVGEPATVAVEYGYGKETESKFKKTFSVFKSGVYPGGAAQSHCHTIHSHLPPEK